MSRRAVSAVVIAMLLAGILTVAFNVQPVKSDYAWTETIYIRSDGSIDPLTAPISSVDNVTYTLTDNIAGNVPAGSSAIIIQRDNITIDGAGHTLQGTQAYDSEGIVLTGRSNVTIKNMEITAVDYGIVLDFSSSNNSVSGNTITSNYVGIYLNISSGNSVSGNTVENNSYGIYLYSSNNNSVDGNNIIANYDTGIYLYYSSNDSVSGNNVTNNYNAIWLDYSSNNNLSGNNITANNGQGIWLDSSSNNSVSGNNITANNSDAIIGISASNNNVNGNNITNNSDGIVWLLFSSNDSVSGNNIAANHLGGVHFDSSDNNSVSENSITANDGPGIWLKSSSNNSVTGNNITANIGAGIYFDSSSDDSVSGNNITSNGQGIWLDYSSNNSLSGNSITKNTYGIYLVSSSNNSIAGNNVTGNRYSGLGFASSSNNSIAGNSFLNDGLFVGDSYENVVTDNLVNSKPLVYLEDVSGYAIGDAGQVILVNCNNVTVENLNLSNCNTGVELWETNNTRVSSNNVTANKGYGILLYSSSNNSVTGNNVTNKNWAGVYLLSSSNNNSVSENKITNNLAGIDIEGSNNTIYHNNIMNNTNQVYSSGSTNVWDDGYPSGGNYWSDYNGTDSNGDGIGDTPHVIDANNTDHYPLMGMFYDFNVSYIAPGYNVELISNSSVSAFAVGFWIGHPEDPNTRIIQFSVTGETGTAGFCRVCIPIALLNASYTVLLNGTEIPCTLLPFSNSTHSYLYFNYTHSTEEVTITPEFPSLLILPMLMIVTLLAIVVSRRKWSKRQTGSRQHPPRAPIHTPMLVQQAPLGVRSEEK